MIWILCALSIASIIFVYWWVQQPGQNTSFMEYNENKRRVF